jgi:hypothetical protein
MATHHLKGTCVRDDRGSTRLTITPIDRGRKIRGAGGLA